MSEVKRFRVGDLISAPFTPLLDDGEINYPFIKKYADYLVSEKFQGVFINGTLAEGFSFTIEERKKLTEAWMGVAKGRLDVIVHVGANCVKDSQELSKHAEELGADAIAALSPSYNKPENEEFLVETMAQIAGAAPKTPFYYYDINFYTGMNINVRHFMELARKKVPTLAGLKYSTRELPGAYACLDAEDGFFQVLMGTDNQYLSCLALGIPGAVTVSFLGNIFYDMRQAFDAGDLTTARELQNKVQRLFSIRAKYVGGGVATAKSLFKIYTGLDTGPVRLPLRSLTTQEYDAMKKELEATGLLDLAKPREQ